MKKDKLAVGCVMPYSNAPEIVDGAALGDNTPYIKNSEFFFK
ncbi:MAG: hypothetical protein V7L23_16830 [Nostoc sp.]